ncbi:MAG TPA: DUF6504 family protein [Humibacillus xanthopallidus]|nr:DUF6504 family protein [Humibacillus xanthopallidus]
MSVVGWCQDCSCGARVVLGRDVRPRRVRRRRVVVRRFSDPVEVRVRGEGVRTSSARPALPVGGQSARDRLPIGSSSPGREPAGPGDSGGDAGGDSGRDPGGGGARPEAFIWRGRLYVVREVLATWRERRAWWREALDADDSRVRPGETLAAAARERQVWRVEASPGWSFAPGVYDLAHDESGPDARPGARDGCERSDGGWSLVRVAD